MCVGASSYRLVRAFSVVLLLIAFTSIAAADGVRVETGYRKGRKFKIKVVPVGRAEVEIATATAFRQMEEAAAEDGVVLDIRSGFRSHQRQQWLYQEFRAGQGNPAERPGYSNHQSGRALDLVIQDEETYAWLTAHARRYGFRRTVAEEPWHWVYVPGKRGERRAARRMATR